MNKANFFIYGLCVWQVGASICYSAQGDFKRGLFWIFLSFANFTFTRF